MKKNHPAIIFLFLAALIWFSLPVSPGLAGEPAETVVAVVGLDEHGQPARQGMGLLVEKDGTVLTSAGLLSRQTGGIVKTGAGDLYLIRKIVRWDPFQDLAVVQLEPESLKLNPAGIAAKVHPPETVWVGCQRPGNLREARLVKTMPFSPRLVLMKLEPEHLASEPGAPVLNRRGELMGMLHSFAAAPGKNAGLRFFLALDRTYLPIKKSAGDEKDRRTPSSESSAALVYSAFWEGMAASLRQDWQGARDKFGAAAAPPENLPEAYYGRGVARHYLGDFPGARQDLEEAIRRLPGYALAFLWLGKTWERQGNLAAAQAAYEQAAAVEPELSEAWFRLGELAYRHGNLKRAGECLERAADDFPQAARTWWYLGIIARTQGRNEAALKAFRRAIRLDPDFSPAYLEGGKLLVEDLGRPKDAVALLQDAVRLAPREALARYYLALAHLLSWNPGGAWEQYFALQEVSPDLASNLAAVLERSR